MRTPCSFGSHLHVALKASSARGHPFAHYVVPRAIEPNRIELLEARSAATSDAHAYGGKRNDAGTRIFLRRTDDDMDANQREIIDAFDHRSTKRLVERLLPVDLSRARLRVCHCMDRAGFWLAPHTDLPEKLATLIIYLRQDPLDFNVATDLFGADLRPGPAIDSHIGDALLFAPGANTYHGFAFRPTMQYRSTLVVNYVDDTWANLGELA